MRVLVRLQSHRSGHLSVSAAHTALVDLFAGIAPAELDARRDLHVCSTLRAPAAEHAQATWASVQVSTLLQLLTRPDGARADTWPWFDCDVDATITTDVNGFVLQASAALVALHPVL